MQFFYGGMGSPLQFRPNRDRPWTETGMGRRMAGSRLHLNLGNPYAVGAVGYWNMPVILGPDGPSLGGFVCLTVPQRTLEAGQLGG